MINHHRKLKIAILIDQLVPGGVQKSAINEAKDLALLGHQITLFVLIRQKYSYQYADLIKGLKVVFLSDFNPKFFRKAIRLPYFFFITNLHLLNPLFTYKYTFIKNFDFLISHGTTTCITAAAISRKYKIPYMAYIWDPMLYILIKVYKPTFLRFLFFILKPLVKMVETDFLRSAAIVVTSSKVHQKYINNTYGINSHVIYPGVYPPKTINKISKIQNRYVLGYTRWELDKNPYFFLWLAEKLPDYIKILIAGTWTNSQEELKFKNLIKQRNLQNRIILTSPITINDLTKIANKSFVWIHPHFEAFGISGLEMAAYGLPIILPRGSGLSELFFEGKHGYFPAAQDHQSFLKRIMYLFINPYQTQKMGIAAANTARIYSWNYHSQCLNKIILDYLSMKKICCINNAFVFTESIGGGDRFLIELAHYIPKNIYMTIILPYVGFVHWQRSNLHKPNIRFIILSKNIFDNQNNIIFIFLTYLIRSTQTYFILKILPPYSYMYSASDLFPDTVPAFIYKSLNPSIIWSTRFFHLIGKPFQRKGYILRNLGSYVLQKLSFRLFCKSNQIIIDNPQLKKELIDKHIQPDKIIFASGGVNYRKFSNSLNKIESTYKSDAIFVGRFSEHKGILDVLNIWYKVIKKLPKAKLVILGYGPKQITQTVQNNIQQLNLINNVTIVGYISDRTILAKYYQGSKIFFFLDYEAGFGLSVVEAMASGLPVLAYKLPIFQTLYKQGFILSDIGNIQATANNALSLLKNNQKYVRLSRLAYLQAKKFDWKIVSREFYKKIINV